MIIFINFGGGSLWYVGPLLFFLSLVADHLQRVWSESGPNGELYSLATLAGFICGIFCVWNLVARTRFGAALRALLPDSLLGGNAAGGPAGNRGQQGGQQRPRDRQQQWDKVVSTLAALPTDIVATQEELQQESSQALRARLQRHGVSCSGCLEKSDLVSKLLEVGGTSGSSCSICCEDYVSGDVVRVLPCQHRYHLECVDRWFLSAVDYSRPPACPMCNSSLLPE